MELRIFATNNRVRSSHMAIIYMQRRGRVKLNRCFAETLGLKAGDRMLMAFDTDAGDWYVSFGEDLKIGYRMYEYLKGKPGGGLVSDYHRGTVNKVLDMVGAERSANFIVAVHRPRISGGRSWYRILTATPELVR